LERASERGRHGLGQRRRVRLSRDHSARPRPSAPDEPDGGRRGPGLFPPGAAAEPGPRRVACGAGGPRRDDGGPSGRRAHRHRARLDARRGAQSRAALPDRARGLRGVARVPRPGRDVRGGGADPRRHQRARRRHRRARPDADPAHRPERPSRPRRRRMGGRHRHGAARPVPDRRARVALLRRRRARRARHRADGHRHRRGAPGPEAPQALMASRERQVAIDAARAAGQLLHAERRAAHRIAFKGTSTNLVTEMDERAEELVVSRLAEAFPDDTILAEERGAARGRSGRRWIVDPLDGTTNYAHGVPVYAVSIALEVDQRIALGVAYDPSADELYVAERGRGATVNDVPLAVSTTPTLEASLLTTGFPYNIRETPDTNLKEYAAFAVRCRGVRRLGSAVLDLAWVAAGRLDGFWELRLGPWDVAAAGLFVEEAGGRITNLVGGAVDVDAPAVVASNGRIHDEMLAVLRDVRA